MERSIVLKQKQADTSKRSICLFCFIACCIGHSYKLLENFYMSTCHNDTGAYSVQYYVYQSYLSASIGFIFAAFPAGYSPKKIPVSDEKRSDTAIAEIDGDIVIFWSRSI